MVRIYVGNLDERTTEDDVRALFAPHGAVGRVFLVTDRATHRPCGFGFVEMPDEAEARAAIDAVHGTVLEGRLLTVNEARIRPPPAEAPAEERPPQ